MAYREHLPHAALRPFVDRFWTRSGGDGAVPREILPDGCIDLILDVDRGNAVVVGTMTRARTVEPGPTRLVAVRFRPGGAVPFLRVAAHTLTDRIVEARAVGLGWSGARPVGDVSALQRVLLEGLPGIRTPDPLVAFAVQSLFGRDPPSVDALARRIGWSRQHLRRALRDNVGVGGKTLGRVARLQRAVDRLQRQPDLALARAAAELGYFDQAHMARDLRALAGIGATTVRARARSIFPIRSLLDGT